MSQHSSRGSAWNKTRKRILDRDGWICTACGKDLVGDDATVDHIVAKAVWIREGRPGNPDSDDNLVSLCRSCNSRKQDGSLPRINWTNPRWI